MMPGGWAKKGGGRLPKTRAEILRLLFAGGNQEIHLRDLARLAGLSPAALQKELTSLAAKEFVLTRRDGNRLYYRANSSHQLFPDLYGIVLKTSGIPGASAGGSRITWAPMFFF